MKSNDLQAALSAFLKDNPDLPAGSEIAEESTVSEFSDIRLHVSVEKKGRGGKTATIIDGLSSLPSGVAETLAKDLKKRLGVGGSYRGDEILLQGELREKVVELLQKKGFKVK